MSYLRPSHSDVAKHAWAILKLLVVRLREGWPKVKITLRADSGFCRWRMLRWCERHGVDYVVGLAKNPRRVALAGEPMQAAAERFIDTGEKRRLFGSLSYAAESWDRPRRVVVKAEHSAQGANPRFIVTGLEGDAPAIYDEILFCLRRNDLNG